MPGRPLCTLDAELLYTTTVGGRALAIYEVTVSVIDGQHLMRPDAECVNRIQGVLGRAQQLHEFELYAYCFMSTHGHLLIGVETVAQKADALCHILGNIARELNRLRGRTGSFFGRRNRPIQVAGEGHALDRLRYIIGQATAANVVAHPRDTPFASSNRWLLEGKPLTGVWYRRDDFGRARRSGTRARFADYTQRLPVRISKLPGMDQLSDAAYRAVCLGLADEVARACRVARKKRGIKLQTAARARAVRPTHKRPRRTRLAARSPAPRVHANAAQRKEFLGRYAAQEEGVVAATRAWRAFEAGARDAPLRYPAGTLPPGGLRPQQARRANTGQPTRGPP